MRFFQPDSIRTGSENRRSTSNENRDTFVKKLRNATVAEKEIRRIVKQVYHDEIGADPNNMALDPMGFDLIVGISYPDKIVCFRSEQDSVRLAEKEKPEVTGAGEPIAKYFFDQYHTPEILPEDGITLAVYILSAVKSSGLGCGGPTDLYILEKGKPPEPLCIGHIEMMLSDLRVPLRDLLFALPKISIEDSKFNAELERIMRLVKSYREANKKYRRPLRVISEDILYKR